MKAKDKLNKNQASKIPKTGKIGNIVYSQHDPVKIDLFCNGNRLNAIFTKQRAKTHIQLLS